MSNNNGDDSDSTERNGGNGEGRDRRTGRFSEGNRCSPGRGIPPSVERLRAKMVSAVTDADIERLTVGLLKLAIEDASGKVRIMATREIFDRIFGRPHQSIFAEIADAPDNRLGVLLGALEENSAELRRLHTPDADADADGNGKVD